MPHFGILNLNKPTGVTSRDVVNRVQRIVRPDKVGHAGTLDPLASGVLVVCLGPATRLIQYVQRMPKRYTATFLLGQESDTEDTEGQVVKLDNPPIPSREELENAIPQFVGNIEQQPPIYSALKIKGRRAYDIARSGEQVDLAPRPVRIDSIDILTYNYPELTLDIACGGGTYIRSLGRDLGRSLGTAALMSALVRTAVGEFHLEDASPYQSVTSDTLEGFCQSPEKAVAQLPYVILDADQLEEISHGRFLAPFSPEEIHSASDEPQRSDASQPPQTLELAAFDSQQRLRSILIPKDDGRMRPTCNFPQPG